MSKNQRLIVAIVITQLCLYGAYSWRQDYLAKQAVIKAAFDKEVADRHRSAMKVADALAKMRGIVRDEKARYGE